MNIYISMYGHILCGCGEYKEAAFRLYTVRLRQADLTQHPQSCSQGVLVSLYNVHVCGSRMTWPDGSVWLPDFNRIINQRSHLAASPPGRRFDTLGLPSLSDPPEMVRPRLLPSLFIRSTVVTPRCSSADRHRHRSTVSISICLTESPFRRGNKRLFSLLNLSQKGSVTHDHILSSLSCLFLVPSHVSVWVNLCDGFRRRRMEVCFINTTQNTDDIEKFRAL